MVIAWEIIRRKHKRRIIMLESVIMMLCPRICVTHAEARFSPILNAWGITGVSSFTLKGGKKREKERKERNGWWVGRKEKRGKINTRSFLNASFRRLRPREETQRCRNRHEWRGRIRPEADAKPYAGQCHNHLGAALLRVRERCK